jgi:omega-6 fatty acid desaturase (delta-12 desaturase)
VGEDYKQSLAPYARPDLKRSVIDIATSVVPYVALFTTMVLLFDQVSYWVILAIGVLAAGFLLRTYIVFHDCTHGSFLPSKRANRVLGIFTGLLVYTPYAAWRHNHAVHHATAGDLDRRGTGDVETMTVAEYEAASPGKRLAYRLYRNPLVMFGIGPIWALVVQPRRTSDDMRPRVRNSVHLTNLALAVIIAGLCLLIGWQTFLLVQLPLVVLAGTAGVWLFYVQHQFEDTYWQGAEAWSYSDAALRGSSYLKLPKVLQFFSGNIGLHHVHHLSARIPNYNLQAAHDSYAGFQSVPVLTFWDGIRAARLKLWDEDGHRLVTWREADQLRRRPLAPAAAAAAE